MTGGVDRPRVVFDCNVFLQAIANDLGPAGAALRLMEAGRFQLFVSRPVLRELRSVLHYPAVRAKLLALDNERIEAFIQHLLFRGTLVRDVPHVFDYPRAKQDEPYVDLAVACKAEFLVSRDKDLLSLSTDHTPLGNEFRQRLPRLRVVDPVAFLNVISPPVTPP